MRAATVVVVVALLAGVAPAGADDIWVSISSPAKDAFVIGEVVVVADVVAAKEIAEVEFFVDGRPVGSVTSPPYRMRLDLGEENVAHRFQVVARDVEGAVASETIVTRPVPVNAEIEVDLEQLYVTALSGERRVLDLEAGDFEVLDEGTEQRLVTFARGDIPFTAALLIDASASMYGDKLTAAIAGAGAFVRQMRDLDRATVLVFSDTLLNRTPFTGDRRVLAAGLSSTRARGGTALADHLYLALKLLEERQGRRVIVVLSDGVDSHSVLDMAAVEKLVRRGQAIVYWIRLGRPEERSGTGLRSVNLSSAWRDANAYRAQIAALEQAVTESGGRLFEVDAIERIEPLFVEILEELREQYVLGYYPSRDRDDGAWHRVEVRVARRGVEARTHLGYVDR